jgi:hypothetical protein
MINTILKLITVLFVGIFIIPSGSKAETVTHTFEGSGETLFEAKQDAIRQALQASLEQLIVVDRAISDTKVIRDKVISTMNGYVEKFVLLDVQQNNAGFRIRADIGVSESLIQNFVGTTTGSDSTFDGGALFAEQNRREAQESIEQLRLQTNGLILDRLFRGYPTDVLNVSLDGIGLDDREPSVLNFDFVISYNQSFINALTSTLEALSNFECDTPPNSLFGAYERRKLSNNSSYYAGNDLGWLVSGRSTDGCPTESGTRNNQDDVFCVASNNVRCFALPAGDYCETCDFENFKPTSSYSLSFQPVIYGAFLNKSGQLANKSGYCLKYTTQLFGNNSLRYEYNEFIHTENFWAYPYMQRPVYRMLFYVTPQIFRVQASTTEIDLKQAHSFVGIVGAGGPSGTSLVSNSDNLETGCERLKVVLERRGVIVNSP